MYRNLFYILLVLFPVSIWGQDVDLSNPRATIYTHVENLKPNNYHPEISAKTLYGLNPEEAVDKAIKLKYIYDAKGGKPNGATPEAIKIMIKNSDPLPVKAAGGVRSYDEAVEMINLGVKRIGTSSAKAIAEGGKTNSDY